MNPGMSREQKKQATAMLKEYLPPRLHKFTFSHGRGTGRYQVHITVDEKEWKGYGGDYFRGLVEGLMVAKGFIGARYTDYGPQNCYAPNLFWEYKKK